MALQERLEDKRKKRDEARRDKKIEVATLEDLHKILSTARETRDFIGENLPELIAEIEEEARLDEFPDDEFHGEHGEQWELRKAAKQERMADEFEASNATIEHVLERIEKHADLRKDFAKQIKALEKDIERLQKKQEAKKDKAGMVSKYFHIAEFHCNDGTPVPDASVNAVEAVAQNHLDKAREAHGTGSVNSGYRTREYNARIGGASLSFHIYPEHPGCAAVDHTFANAAPRSVQSWYDSHTNPNGMGYYSSFTHIDNRSYRSRWYGS